ncbi:TPA: baseplate protein [Citrobacter freundii]|nr:baseplate protein [Citrobacter freundii]HCD1268071.1 baseplate protein [Citrobacter freundii]
MANNTYSRLDDRCIEDPVIRAYLHREVLEQANSSDTTNLHYEIKLDEVYRADLAAQRCWGNMDLRWVFRLVAGHESLDDAFEPGTIYTVPSASWIRDRVRHYVDNPEIENNV